MEATDYVSSSGLVVLYTWTCTLADYHLLLSYCGHVKWMAVICNNVTLLFMALINKLIVSSLYRLSYPCILCELASHGCLSCTEDDATLIDSQGETLCNIVSFSVC